MLRQDPGPGGSPKLDLKDYLAGLLDTCRDVLLHEHSIVAYVFANHCRKADFRERLQNVAVSHNVALHMFEFDILVDDKHDVLNVTVWGALVRFVHNLGPFCVLGTPPCS